MRNSSPQALTLLAKANRVKAQTKKLQSMPVRTQQQTLTLLKNLAALKKMGFVK
jgi:hypothetical protein